MTNKLKEAVQLIIDAYGQNKKMSVDTLKELGYVLGDTCLAITTTKDDSDEEIVFKIHQVLTEKNANASFSYLQRNEELDSGEIIDKSFKHFQKL